MTRESRNFSRRKFLKDTTLAAAVMALGHTLIVHDPASSATKPRTKVVLIRDKSVISATGAVDGDSSSAPTT